MKLGLYGGTFDPVHVGHLLLAEACRQACGLNEVRWLPAPVPPHKQERELTPERLRADMVKAAIAGHEAFKLDRREAKRAGPSYTVETLAEVQAELPEAELFFLMGADSLADFVTWRDPAGILQRATVVVATRAGHAPPDFGPIISQCGLSAASRLRAVTMPEIGVASHALRDDVAAGRSIRYQVPRAVECLIKEHGLYRGGEYQKL